MTEQETKALNDILKECWRKSDEPIAEWTIDDYMAALGIKQKMASRTQA